MYIDFVCDLLAQIICVTSGVGAPLDAEVSFDRLTRRFSLGHFGHIWNRIHLYSQIGRSLFVVTGEGNRRGVTAVVIQADSNVKLCAGEKMHGLYMTLTLNAVVRPEGM